MATPLSKAEGHVVLGVDRRGQSLQCSPISIRKLSSKQALQSLRRRRSACRWLTVLGGGSRDGAYCHPCPLRLQPRRGPVHNRVCSLQWWSFSPRSLSGAEPRRGSCPGVSRPPSPPSPTPVGAPQAALPALSVSRPLVSLPRINPGIGSSPGVSFCI